MKWRLARKAYEAYRAHTAKGATSKAEIAIHMGQWPEWDDLRNDIRDAWAAAIVGIREDLLNEMQVAMDDARYRIGERFMA